MALNEVPAVFTVNKHKHSDNRQIIDQHEPVPGNSVITMHSEWSLIGLTRHAPTNNKSMGCMLPLGSITHTPAPYYCYMYLPPVTPAPTDSEHQQPSISA